jgi:ribonuclease P protein subunit RPR2
MKSKKEIARERINLLFKKANEIYKEDSSLSNRYVEIARKIAMKAQVNIPSNFRKKFCRKCYAYLVPGENCRVRTRNKKLIYYCMECKNIMRFPYK